MKIFKNGVGRPSIQTLRKRKIAIFAIVFVIAITLFCTINFFMNRTIFADSKNFKVNYKEPKFVSVYSKQNQAVVKTEKNSTVVLGCPEGYVYYKNRKCINKNTPVALSLTFNVDTAKSTFPWLDPKYNGKSTAKKLCNTKGYNNVEKVKSILVSETKSKRTYKVTANCIDWSAKKQLKDVTKTTVPYYKQGDYYSTPSACGGGNLNKKGCLPTSGAMIFSALTGKKITPVNMNSYASDLLGTCKGSCSIVTKNYKYKTICSSSSYHVDFLKVHANNNGMDYLEGLTSSASSSIEEYLMTGKCVGVAPLQRYGCVGTASKAGICTNVGHFVVFAASQKNEYVTVKDPLYSNKANIEVKTKDLIQSTQSNRVVLFCKKGILKTPSENVSTE